jgi:GT2 family glycosyltransferase
MMSISRVSIIIPSRQEGEWLQKTVDSILPTLTESDEVIVADDRSTDHSADFLASGEYASVRLVRTPEHLGSARSRNYGASFATGDLLVFSDSHVLVPPGWREALVEVASGAEIGAVGVGIADMGPSQVGYGQVWKSASLENRWLPRQGPNPYPVPLLGGGFVALPADVFRYIGGFDSGIEVWGSEDSELSFRVWSLGKQCVVAPSVIVRHRFRPEHPTLVSFEEWIHNKLRLARLHFRQRRVDIINHYWSISPSYGAARARLERSDVDERRRELDRMRVRDDDWFFETFKHPWADFARAALI